MSYQNFLKSKHQVVAYQGFEVELDSINSMLFPFQREIVKWAIRRGKAAIFADTGLGKTFMQVEFARLVVEYTQSPFLILAPLAVAQQTIREAAKLGVAIQYAKSSEDVNPDIPIVITNYERLHRFDVDQFAGVALDESSILKSFTGKIKRSIIDAFSNTQFKLACTATPAPNDYLELGNHADFLDIMASNEMISRWFINDSMSAGNYRLKEHAKADFWRWLTSWAVCISKPSDLGQEFDMPSFTLPNLNIVEVRIASSDETWADAHANGLLIPDSNPSSTGMHKVKRQSANDRATKAAEILATIDPNEPVLIWCDTNYEADALLKVIPDAVELRGNHAIGIKENRLLGFADGDFRIFITKPDIAGFGMNYQHCAHMIFVGVSYSFEKLYQSLRRSWRFGQQREVSAYLIFSEAEGGIMEKLREKQAAFAIMQGEMNAALVEHGLYRDLDKRNLTKVEFAHRSGKDWTMYQGDCVDVTSQLPDDSIDFTLYSPPFSNLYIYSDSEADMGNSSNHEEFFDHYEYLVEELYRVTRAGRLCAVHCKDLPLYMNRDGAAGLYDFAGEIIRRHEKHGWVFHSRVTIWKDPVIEMQRTKNHGLLHKNFTDRAEATRQGMADYLIVFRKWPIEGGVEVKQERVVGDYIGTNPPTEGEIASKGKPRQTNYSIAVWQRYASPVWFDINQTNVLNGRIARDSQDEKHICPLQLDVIARSIDIWTNKGDVVLTPFAGIGSEVVTAIKMGRKAIGIELKPSYYDIACGYAQEAEFQSAQPTLFDLIERS